MGLKKKIVMVLVFVFTIFLLIDLFWSLGKLMDSEKYKYVIPEGWEFEETCSSRDAFTKDDLEKGMNCQLEDCIETEYDNYNIQECFCGKNNQTVRVICTQKILTIKLKNWERIAKS